MSIMVLANSQKAVVSNIFRDLTKLTVVALVLSQFVPGQEFNVSAFLGGVSASFLMTLTAILFAAPNKEED